MSYFEIPHGSVLLCNVLKQEERRQRAKARRAQEEFERHMIRDLIFANGRVDVRIEKRTLRRQEVG